jgi:hypothetical protein
MGAGNEGECTLRGAPLHHGHRSFQLQQVPQISVEILEYRDGSVALLLGLAHEDDTSFTVRAEVAPEVVSMEKEEHSTTC